MIEIEYLKSQLAIKNQSLIETSLKMETLQKTSNGNQVKTEKIDIIKNEKLSIKSFLLLKAEKNTGNKARYNSILLFI